jgi:ferredoxin
VDTCPDVFEMGDEIAEVIVDNVPPELEETAQQAVDECPVEAIVAE